MSDVIDEGMQEIIGDFLVEAKELIEKIDLELVILEKKPDDLELLNSIFRAMHTIKGTSSFIGLNKITEFTHDVENVLNKLRNTEIKLTPHIMDVILESVDITKVMISDVENSEDTPQDVENICSKINQILSGPIDVAEKDKKDKKIGELLIEKGLATEEDIEDALDDQSQSPKLGEILVEKKVISEEDLDQVLSMQKKPKFAIEQTIRVEIKRLDDMMNLVSELVLGRNRLMQISKYFEETYENEVMSKNLLEVSNSFDVLTSDMHSSVLKVRMMTINKVFSKYPRMVRDLTKGTGKEVDLHITGEDTELDKTIIEYINDPLVHLIRNAIDHGIEDPSTRFKKGKVPKGKVDLRAYHEGNDIIIEIEDDGKGLDSEKIKAKALKNKLLTESELERISESDLFNLVFEPGFSTADKITDISGRGVGMDVVKTNIEKLKGVIEIKSAKDKGTSIKLKLPLTLEILQALLIETSGELFAIPLTSIMEILLIKKDDVRTVRQKEAINIRDSILNIIRLEKIFSLNEEENNTDYEHVVVLGNAQQRLGLVVSKLIGKEEIVIKPIHGFTQATKCIAGATIMGNGHVSLVIDVSGLFRTALS